MALRLSDARLFVGGGYDADGHAVASVERFDANATESVPYESLPELPARFDRAFAALPGGSVLAVGGCEERDPEPGEDCSACRRGCPPAEFDAYWIAQSGEVETVELDVAAPRPLLLPGSDGSPWLIVQTDGGVRALRFNPFRARFELESGTGELPDPKLVPPVSIAPDHFVWIGPGDLPSLFGLRASTRGRFSNDVGLVATSHPLDPLWPEHLAPDRRPSSELYDERALELEPEARSCTSPTRSSATWPWRSSSSKGRRRSWSWVDATLPCGFPGSAGEASERVRFLRVGSALSFERGDEISRCEGPIGDFPIGVAAPSERTSVTALSLARLLP